MTEEVANVVSKIASRETKMSSAALTRQAATSLMQRIEPRKGSRMLAYQTIASGINRSTTWVRALIREGKGRVDGDIGRAIDALLIREIEAEIARLSHELQMARQRGCAPGSPEILEAQTLVARATALLNRGRGE